MKAITAAQSREFDKKAQERYLVPSIILMENAGRHAAEEALKMLTGRQGVCIFCGRGNNGGDGFVAARHLLNNKKDVKVFLAGNKSAVKSDALTNLKIIGKMGVRVRELTREKQITAAKKACAKAGLIIDALLGTGAKGDVTGLLKGVIEFINESGKKVLSIDVPSGLDATTGRVMGVAVKADKTVTFAAVKTGFYKGRGPRYTGRVVVKDIGIK